MKERIPRSRIRRHLKGQKWKVLWRVASEWLKKMLKAKKWDILFNILVGIAALSMADLLQHTDWAQKISNEKFDTVVVREAEEAAEPKQTRNTGRNDRISDQILFIEIDHDTYKNWKKPLIIPRDKLAHVVKAAWKGEAKVIVLDFLFDHRDCFHPGSDDKLRRTLEEMTVSNSGTKVIFPLGIGADEDVSPNVFDDLIRKNPSFYRAMPNSYATASDAKIRYWAPFKACTAENELKIFFNVSFVAAVLAEGKEARLQELEKTIKDDILLGKVEKSYPFGLDRRKDFVLPPQKGDRLANRIRYLLVPKNTMASHPGGNLFDNIYSIEDAAYAQFKDKIVIIGNSSPDAGDIHRTPIGNMAGMFVIGNAVNTISQGIQLSQAAWGSWAFAAIAILAAAILFVFSQSFVVHLFYAILVAVLVFLCYPYFQYKNTFVNPTLATTTIALMGVFLGSLKAIVIPLFMWIRHFKKNSRSGVRTLKRLAKRVKPGLRRSAKTQTKKHE